MYNYVQEYAAIHCNNANYHQVPKNKYLKRDDEMVLKKHFLDALEGYFCWEKAFAIWVKWGNPFLVKFPISISPERVWKWSIGLKWMHKLNKCKYWNTQGSIS